MKKISCSLSFDAYVKKVRKKVTKCSLKTTELLLNADGHVLTYVWCLSRYGNFKLIEEPQKLLTPWLFPKIFFAGCQVWNSTCPTNIASTAQSAWIKKNYIQAWF